MKSLLRLLIVSLLMTSFYSCDYLSFQRKKDFEKINTDIDTTDVDMPPSIDVCNGIIDKKEKANCFGRRIHEEISSSLKSQNIKVKNSIDETVKVIITIHADKRVTLKSIDATEKLYQQIPDFKKMIEKAISDLPEIFSAIKRETPVTSEYVLPIRIKLKG